MMKWILIVGMVSGCCCRKHTPPAPVADLAEPAIIRNPGNQYALLVANETACGAMVADLAHEDWTRLSTTVGCKARGSTKATLLRRGDDCVKVRVEAGSCRGDWWTYREWVGK